MKAAGNADVEVEAPDSLPALQDAWCQLAYGNMTRVADPHSCLKLPSASLQVPRMGMGDGGWVDGTCAEHVALTNQPPCLHVAHVAWMRTRACRRCAMLDISIERV